MTVTVAPEPIGSGAAAAAIGLGDTMEGTDVGQTVTMTIEVVRARLKALEDLLGDLDGVLPGVADIEQRQGPQLWSTIPECVAFANQYAASLRALHQNLLLVRGRVQGLQVDLAESARTLGLVDADIESRLVALANRLAAAPTTPAPSMPAPSAPVGPPVSSGGGSW
ncbi:MAG: hypothetical protein JWP95_2224 [Actinotalea sp.]|nr:hypothetical protein [Actinotalea sp.]